MPGPGSKGGIAGQLSYLRIRGVLCAFSTGTAFSGGKYGGCPPTGMEGVPRCLLNKDIR